MILPYLDRVGCGLSLDDGVLRLVEVAVRRGKLRVLRAIEESPDAQEAASGATDSTSIEVRLRQFLEAVAPTSGGGMMRSGGKQSPYRVSGSRGRLMIGSNDRRRLRPDMTRADS